MWGDVLAHARAEITPTPFPYAAPRYVDGPGECFFYHTLELPGYGLQKGCWDLRDRFDSYIGYVDLVGKRVLDVGAATGFLSFEAERSGAREVVSFDLDTAARQHLLPFRGSRYVDDHAGWCAEQTQAFVTWQRAYWLAHRLYGSRAKAVYGDVYDPPAGIGVFDVVIVGAILEHLIDPLHALRALARHAAALIVINTDFAVSTDLVAYFNGRADNPARTCEFWTYSIPLYDEYMKIMGFEPLAACKGQFPGRGHRSDTYLLQERVALVYRRTS